MPAGRSPFKIIAPDFCCPANARAWSPWRRSSRVSAEHQSLLHFVAQAPWSDDAVLSKVRALVLPTIEAQGGPIEAWIVDDTGFAKKGAHSVGVARQYCGRLGKTDNCQTAVSLSIANHAASLPVAWRLYLPREWTSDDARRGRAHVPDDVTFKTKPRLALEQIGAARAAGVPEGVVLPDAAYGTNADFREGLTRMELRYAVGVQSNVSVWPLGAEPLPAQDWSGRGRRPTRLREAPRRAHDGRAWCGAYRLSRAAAAASPRLAAEGPPPSFSARP
jgi:SRSO17 transposase